jgi:dienelactone hydrolase
MITLCDAQNHGNPLVQGLRPGTMVTMRRRTALVGLAAAVTGAVTGCAAQRPRATTPEPSPNPSAAATPSTHPLYASATSSSLKPRPAVPYVPPAGTAPVQSFAVGRRDFPFARADRRLPVRAWYPSVGAAGGEPVDAATPASGRFPLVLFSHGLTAQPNDFAALLTRWAQAGFIAIAPTYPHTSYGAPGFDPTDVLNQPADASAVLSQFLALADPLVQHVDRKRIAAAGHSGGGITTAGLFSSERDRRLTAGIIIAGTDFAGAPFVGPPAAMLMVHGRNDTTVRYAAGHTVFRAIPWSRAMLTITNGDHVIDADSFEAVTRTTTEFLRWSLHGDAAARSRIPSAAAVNGVATLQNQL